ncbi:D-cysteate sulfo-lyase [Salibacterium aidingense]|uniref:D-cysteine desulfhydrase n=1 Tax=Salibacterium aidingense TaxID=384933 RepID=UPI00041015B6|nr:D-cysteine desulfhydrase [Salibacterium aidingense]
MNLAKFPRRIYTEKVTPIQFLPQLSEFLNGPNVYIKRDDLLGLVEGGNKTRKLEFLIADALEQGADTVITCGAVQSNHCRLTLAAANKEGLKCILVLEERVPKSYNPNATGNNALFSLLGAEDVRVVPGGSDMNFEMEKVASELSIVGRKSYIIPGGGSNEIGATGYVACTQEILHQTFQLNLNINHIITASGSGGTHSGLIAGLSGFNASIPVTGINVSRKKEEQEELIYNLSNRTASHIGANKVIDKKLIHCFDNYVGKGYSIPTSEMKEAVQVLARKEGILLDPVYSGKAMAGLIDLARKDYFNKNDNVLFIHTGGSPALYHYSDVMF